MTSLETLVLQKRQEQTDWCPRAELGKILGVTTDLSTFDNTAFLRTVVTEISEALPDRVVNSSLSAKTVIARHAQLSYEGLLDPITLAQSSDRSMCITTSLGGHPDVLTRFSANPHGDITIRREQSMWSGGKTEILPNEATETTLTYDEYVDALALDLAGACRELIDIDPELLAEDDRRAILIAR